MGNRAVITHAPFKQGNAAIYVHWNGGRESIEGFCGAAKELGFRSPDGDSAYGLARLTSIIALYFGLTQDTSVGIGTVSDFGTDQDNGVYVIGNDWQIVDHFHDAKSNKVERFEGYDAEERKGLEAKADAIRKQIVVQTRICHDACQAVDA